MKLILVSACLAGKKCRYDGKDNVVPELKALCEQDRAIAVCPEMLGGLPTPRTPAEIQGYGEDRRVITKLGEDVTNAFQQGALISLQIAQKNQISIAIMKSRSPSCGFGKIYDGEFTGTLTNGKGLAAELLDANGIEVYSEEYYPEQFKAQL